MQNVLKFNGLNDYIFKELFNNKSILVEYINVLLDLNITEDDIVYHHSELQTDIEAKGSRFDVLIKLLKSRIDIEAQKYFISNEFQNHRKIHYASQLHSKAYKRGDLYFKKHKTYIIFLLDYKFKDSDLIYHRTKYHNLDTDEVYDDIEILEISLKNIKNDDTIKERMLKVLSEYDISKYQNDTGIIKEVISMISEFNEDERKRLDAQFAEDHERTMKTLYEQWKLEAKEEGLKEGMKEGLKEGLEQGKKEGLQQGLQQGQAQGEKNKEIELVKSMAEANISLEQIAIITKLSIDEIINIIK